MLAVVGQLLLKRPKHLGLDWLELKADLVAHSAAASDLVGAFAFEAVGNQPPLLRQRVMGAGGDFGKREIFLIRPGDDMAGTRDVDRGLVIATLHSARAVDLKELGMQCAAVQLKHQLGDFGSDGKHDTGSLETSTTR